MADFTEMDTFGREYNVVNDYTLVEEKTLFAPDNVGVNMYELPASSSLDTVQ